MHARIVARFFFLRERESGSRWLFRGSRWHFVAFLSGEWLGAFFLPSFPVADIIHNSRVQCSEAVSDTNYGLHTADVAATGILLFLL